LKIPYLIIILFISTITVSGCLNTPKYFENNDFSFKYPEGWKTYTEFWPANFGFNFKTSKDKELNLEEVTGVLDPQSSTKFEKYTTSVIIKKRNLPQGSSLQNIYKNSYSNISNSTTFLNESTITIDGVTAYSKIYKKGLGESLFQIKDIWLEKNGNIYVISCRALFGNFEKSQDNFDVIINSFHVK
jgi:hypothetical protein